MRLHALQRMLSSIPPHPAPKVELEQYATPADLAAPLLFEAWTLGDIEGKVVVDLGCGTGVFAIGAALLGAREVVGLDVDAAALEVARASASKLGATVDWREGDVRSWTGRADTVVSNPPFGAQTPGADRPFLETAFASAPVAYLLHSAPAREFVVAFAQRSGFAPTHEWALKFDVAHVYRHHTKAKATLDVRAYRFVRQDNVSTIHT